MAGNLGDLVTRILQETNRDVTYQQAVKNAIITAIKFMERNLPRIFQTQTTLTLPQGSNVVALPSDFNSLIFLRYNFGGTWYDLSQGFAGVDLATLLNYFGSVGTTGYPKKYAIFGNNIYIYPTGYSDVDLEMFYYYKDANYPVNDSDVSIWFNDDTIDALRYKARSVFISDTLQTPELATADDQRFEEFRRNLIMRNNNAFATPFLAM